MSADRARLLTEYLAALARAGAPMPANLDIAAALDWDYDWVWRAISDAERLGLLRRVGQPHAPNRGIEAGDGSWRLGNGRGALKRKCLRCSDEFRPESRFLFCCYGCRRANAGEAA